MQTSLPYKTNYSNEKGEAQRPLQNSNMKNILNNNFTEKHELSREQNSNIPDTAGCRDALQSDYHDTRVTI